MTDLLRLVLVVLASLFKSRAELEVENLVLPQQINVLRQRTLKRPALTNVDRLPVGFRLLYGLVILRLQRRQLVWINVTSNPTADWIARQITEAFP
jgi:hypothetical protein